MNVEDIWAEAQRREATARRKWTFSSILILSIIVSYIAFAILGFPGDSSSTFSLQLKSSRAQTNSKPALRQLSGCGFDEQKVQGLQTQAIDAATCGSPDECLRKMNILQEQLQSSISTEVRGTCADQCKGGRGYITGVLNWSRQQLKLDSPYEAFVAGEFCCRCS